MLYFNWFNFLSVGIVDNSFQSTEIGKYATPTRLQTFPMVKSKTIGFLLDQTHQYTSVHFGKSSRELLPEKVQLSSHYAA